MPLIQEYGSNYQKKWHKSGDGIARLKQRQRKSSEAEEEEGEEVEGRGRRRRRKGAQGGNVPEMQRVMTGLPAACLQLNAALDSSLHSWPERSLEKRKN